VSGQLHAPAALLSEKEPLILIGQGAGWAPEPVWALVAFSSCYNSVFELCPIHLVLLAFADNILNIFFSDVSISMVI